jgi:uncharacterized protein (DUF1778 family)
MVVVVGRRKKARKDAHLNVRCTPEQRAIIGAAAAKLGISASSWVLSLALREAGVARSDAGA